MKELRKNMRRLGVLMICLFVGLGVWYAITVYDQGGQWASDVHNTRNSKSLVRRGSIYDRKNTRLAYTDANGNRVYLTDEQERRALSQTVGDSAGMSGTGVETKFSSTLLDTSTSLLDRLAEVFGGGGHVGSSIWLTVSKELTAYASKEFPANYRGAVVVLNYKTGEILCMVSRPDYDPNVLLNRANSTQVEDSAYLNRCLQGLYTPGSVFKIVTLTGALTADPTVTGHNYTCTARWDFGSGTMVCGSGTTAHGTLDLKSAFARSCNVTFGKLTYAMGRDLMINVAQSLCFNDNFKFHDITLYNSSFPTDMKTDNALVWSGIGQGTVQVTPMHMCMISAAVANGGVMQEPILVRRIESSTGGVTYTGVSRAYRTVMKKDVADTVASYMYNAVANGTARNAAIKGYSVCGKTGTAQVTDDNSRNDSSWFTGFVYDDAHPYAIAVVIEEGGAGSNLASRLASKVLAQAIKVIG